MSRRKRVVFATIALHQMAGGLERNLVRIANYLSSQDFDVSIISFDLSDAQSFYPINENVTWHRLGQTLPHRSISFIDRFNLLRRVRRELQGDPTIIVFQHGLLPRLIGAGLGLKKSIICSERNSLSMYDHIRASKWNAGFFLMFFASKILVQFETYKKNYPLWLRFKIDAIPNIVETANQIAMPDTPNPDGRFAILAVGRLCDQKNYAALISAFAKISNDFPDWDLVIIGNGALEKNLRKHLADLNLTKKIIFTGAVTDVANWYGKSHLYAMPSKWEGFPNALAEALAHGLPAVGFQGCAGVNDLIKNGENGLLAAGNGDVETLTQCLVEMMRYPSTRVRMGRAAVQTVAKYRAEEIYPMWKKLLENF